MRVHAVFVVIFLFTQSIFAQKLAPQDFYRSPHFLVKISSILYDHGLKKETRVFGVGSVFITMKNGLFKSEPDRVLVLTASHVASGKNLIVETRDGQIYPIKRFFHHPSKDISVLEIAWRNLAPGVEPFGNFLDGRIHTLFDASESNLRKKEGSYGYVTMLSHYAMMKQPVIPIEISVPHKISTRPSVVLQPPWLEAPALSNLSGTEWLKSVSRDPKMKTGTSVQVFPQGFSGAPLLITEGGGFIEGAKFYLSGMLTTSSGLKDRSAFLGPAHINEFIQKIFDNKVESQPLSKNYWFLIHGTFVSAKNQNLEVFLLSGPIGNGLVIEGSSSEDLIMNSREDYLQELSLRGILPERIIQLVDDIERIKSAIDNVSEGKIRQAALDLLLKQVSSFQIK